MQVYSSLKILVYTSAFDAPVVVWINAKALGALVTDTQSVILNFHSSTTATAKIKVQMLSGDTTDAFNASVRGQAKDLSLTTDCTDGNLYDHHYGSK